MKIYSIWYETNARFPETTLIQGDRPVCVNGDPQPKCDVMILLFEAESWNDAVKVYEEFIQEWFYHLLGHDDNLYFFESEFIEGYELLVGKKCLFPKSGYNSFIELGEEIEEEE